MVSTKKYFEDLDHTDLCRRAKLVRRASIDMGLRVGFDYSRSSEAEYIDISDDGGDDCFVVRFADHDNYRSFRSFNVARVSGGDNMIDGGWRDAVAAIGMRFNRIPPKWSAHNKH